MKEWRGGISLQRERSYQLEDVVERTRRRTGTFSATNRQYADQLLSIISISIMSMSISFVSTPSWSAWSSATPLPPGAGDPVLGIPELGFAGMNDCTRNENG